MFKTWLIIGYERPEKNDPLFVKLQELGLYSNINPNGRKQMYIWVDRNGMPSLGFEDKNECSEFFLFFQKDKNKKEIIKAFAKLPRQQLELFHKKKFSYDNMSIEFSYESLEKEDKFSNPYHRRFISVRYAKFIPTTDLYPDSKVCASRDAFGATKIKGWNNLLLNPNQITIESIEHLNILYGAGDKESGIVLLPPWRAEIPDNYYFHKPYFKIRKLLHKCFSKNETADSFGISLWKMTDDAQYRDMLIEGALFNLSLENGVPNQVNCILNTNAKAESLSADWRRHFILNDTTIRGPSWLKHIISSIAKDFEEPAKDFKVNFQEVKSVDEKTDKDFSWEVEKIDFQDKSFGSAKEGEYHMLQYIQGKFLSGKEKNMFREKVLIPSSRDNKSPNNYMAIQNFISYSFRCPWNRGATQKGSNELWQLFIEELILEIYNSKEIQEISKRLAPFKEVLWKEKYVWFHKAAEVENIITWRLRLPANEILKLASSNTLDGENTKLDFDLILS